MKFNALPLINYILLFGAILVGSHAYATQYFGSVTLRSLSVEVTLDNSTNIAIMSLEGKILSKQILEAVKSAQIDVSEFPSGTYFLIVRNEDWNSPISWVKN